MDVLRHAPAFSADEATSLALRLFGVEGAATTLPSERDQNFLIRTADGDRFVLVEGLHRLEACRKLGEQTIDGYRVQARRH